MASGRNASYGFYLSNVSEMESLDAANGSGADDGGGGVNPPYGVHIYELFDGLPAPAKLVMLAGAALSIFCLAATLCTFALFEQLQTLPGKMITCFVCSFAVSQTLTTVGMHRFADDVVCFGVAVAAHYSTLAVFLWSNAIAVDMATCFGGSLLRMIRHTMDDARRFRWFCTYAWGLPTLVCGACAMTALRYPHLGVAYGGDDFCLISGWKGTEFALALPELVVVVVNGALFVVVVVKMISTLLSFTWLFAFLSAFTGQVALWYIFTVVDALSGIYIFAVFVLNKRVRAIWIS
ncbi:PREDICTED: latrophilin-like protein LAT-2 [Priapulus caudatus]|uniref:Latrophilin-like protein LAT-2 n=1 Tax=Priapulus caudatus TaxID=37621 RepID=A0ABM1FAS3_PRICU|nr:PREDICTED: latrophilin-like protein LAT-2 [Priapulus caudatus]